MANLLSKEKVDYLKANRPLIHDCDVDDLIRTLEHYRDEAEKEFDLGTGYHKRWQKSEKRTEELEAAITALTAERDALKKAIIEHWVEKDVCRYCGRDIFLDEGFDDKWRCNHDSDCIVLTTHPDGEKEGKGK